MSQTSAIIIGSGPNGLAAAIALSQAGCDVEVREAASTPGGGARTAEITLPGFLHDLGSAVHPMAVSSPFFSELPLAAHGLEWIHSPAPLAHALDDGSAVLLERSVEETADQFGRDAKPYRKLFRPLAENWNTLTREILRPLTRASHHPLLVGRFGIRAIQPATLAAKAFRDARARALFAGLAAHSTLKLEAPLSSAFAFIMGAAGHAVGWPIPKRGAQSITDALCAVLESLGGRVVTNSRVESLDALGAGHSILCDVMPRQFLSLAGERLPLPFRELLGRYKHAPGVFKVDWALREPIPWRAQGCFRAATVHLGGSFEEIAESERAAWEGRAPRNPFIILVQPSLFDPARAPEGKHTAWAYCHVPNGWRGSALDAIEEQVERFAPGFQECILARAVHGTADLERWNANLIGGDVSGGAPTLKQFFLRPTWRRYGTPLKNVYLCSSATPPGGAVHGMCGYWAAQWALRELKSRQ
ncbi:MAG TPA: NAD(P)/FAD-dependent oxidoreductase [Bryobacteraceae bacterium]